MKKGRRFNFVLFFRPARRHSVWYCLQKCAVNTITSGEVRVGQKCELCSGDMAEYPRYRHMSDYVVITMMPCEAVRMPRRVGEIFRGVRIKLNGNYRNL